MSGSTLLQFTLLSNQDKIAARTATCAWETLLDGTTTLSMYDTIDFFHEQVAPAIKDWGVKKWRAHSMLTFPLPSWGVTTLSAHSSYC